MIWHSEWQGRKIVRSVYSGDNCDLITSASQSIQKAQLSKAANELYCLFSADGYSDPIQFETLLVYII